jgi:hypothetical protein
METVNIDKDDFNNLLSTVEILISDVEKLRGQEEISQKRVLDIEEGKVEGKTEKDYNEYLRKRGISC